MRERIQHPYWTLFKKLVLRRRMPLGVCRKNIRRSHMRTIENWLDEVPSALALCEKSLIERRSLCDTTVLNTTKAYSIYLGH